MEPGALACEALRVHRVRQLKGRLQLKPDETWQENGLIFCTKYGTPPDQGRVHRHWRPALEKAGLLYRRIHDLRHTIASLWLVQGEHPKVVPERLGHSTVSLTLDTHSHVAPSMQRDAADRFGARIRATREAR